LTVTDKYNAFGERQVKANNGVTTRYVYDGPALMHERVGSTKRDFIYLDGQVVAMVKSGALYFVHTDHLGRPEIVTNSDKSKVWQAQNDAWTNTPTIEFGWPFRILEYFRSHLVCWP
jgi:uncharacterized protein RhaS with RHS repeats